MRHRHLLILTLLATVTAACATAGASDPTADDEGRTADEVAAPAAARIDGLCDAAAALFALPAEASDAEAGAVVGALVEHAPDDVAADVQTLIELGATGDGLGAYTDATYTAADAAVTDAVVDDCGLDPLRVDAGDYAFAGIPTELEAGRVVVELANTSSSEVHELSLLRRNDDVDASFEELFELPDEEATAMVSPYGTTIVGPDATTVLVTDLPPGEYLAACFLPVDSLAGGDAEPHVARGMFHTFTVTS